MQTITASMPPDTAGTVRRRSKLPAATLLVAASAAVLAVVAIATDDVGSIKPTSTPAVVTVAGPNASTGVAPGDPIVNESDGGACRLRAITTTCP